MYLIQCLSCAFVDTLCILQQSLFHGDDRVSFCMGFFRYHAMLDDYARCRLCGVDMKVSSRGLASFRVDVRKEKDILRDSAFCCAHQILSLTEDVVAMTSWPFGRRLRLVEGRLLPLMDSITEVSVAQAMENE